MTTHQWTLICLAEECVEVAQRVTKLQRFGPMDIQPGQPLNNKERLEYELDDLITVIDLLAKSGVIRRPVVSSAKYAKLHAYATYAKSIGIIHDK